MTATKARVGRVGCEVARIYTPPARELTPETSDGWRAIKFAEEILGLTLLPWQKWLLIHALELRPDGLYRFRTVVVSVARQNGKTLIMIVLALWHIYLRGSRTVIATAQDLANAEKAWEEAVEMAEGDDDLAEEIRDVVRRNGHKALVLESGHRYRVAAASRRGARGFSGDLVLLDELREHTTWDAWGASTKTTLARPKAQVWGFSNAGDAMSVVLRYLRALAHQALDWPDGDGDKDILTGTEEDFELWEDELDDDSLGWFEWSAPPTAKRNDRDAWAQANPSLGYTITERAIAAALRTDPPHVFLPEVMCRWLSTSPDGPFPEDSWSAARTEVSDLREGSPLAACVDVSWNRSMTYIALAGWCPDGVPQVEIQAARAGTAWARPWLVDKASKLTAVTLQANGAPVSSLLPELEEEFGPDGDHAGELDVRPWAGADVARASGLIFDRLVKPDGADDDGEEWPRIRILGHPGLELAAHTAVTKPAGESWVINRPKSPNDAAPLVAVFGALWLLLELPEQTESVYETGELMIV